MLSRMPKQPSPKFKVHIAPFGRGLLIEIHMKHGYANVKGTAAIPPIKGPKLPKKGKATDIKKVSPPKKRRNPVRTHCGHRLFLLLAYINSKLSKAGIA
ncbi:hypothetical protein COLO4_17990 [Corchorus olitorius]|uniref:Uncharacterized protein n=1 Tax=Corchorus olitorius TaxID=93759 RepID=A0A1R3JB33_9ROSI|nr:hypothetical protein COLO4_17990 [Corchorus olitorius]